VAHYRPTVGLRAGEQTRHGAIHAICDGGARKINLGGLKASTWRARGSGRYASSGVQGQMPWLGGRERSPPKGGSFSSETSKEGANLSVASSLSAAEWMCDILLGQSAFPN